MVARAENPYRYPPRCRKKKKRGSEHRTHMTETLVAWILLAAVLLGSGILCLRGAQKLWYYLSEKVSFLNPENPVFVLSHQQNTTPQQPAKELSVTWTGVHDFVLYQNDDVNFWDGVHVCDASGGALPIMLDDSNVDLTTPGDYTLRYMASDTAGNDYDTTAAVTVLEMREGYVPLETIYAAVDQKLQEILRSNATAKEQVHDIYAWARLNLSYGGHSDRADWRQSGYTMLTEGRGDCFGFFAVTKLMFERLGIINLDVRKVKNSPEDSDHFWSLVSLDGGESWYHFDATPRAGAGDDFCLVTDDFLDAYSRAHKGSHNRDKSLYPATP